MQVEAHDTAYVEAVAVETKRGQDIETVTTVVETRADNVPRTAAGLAKNLPGLRLQVRGDGYAPVPIDKWPIAQRVPERSGFSIPRVEIKTVAEHEMIGPDTLVCENGGHPFIRPNAKGPRPRNCPEHKRPARG